VAEPDAAQRGVRVEGAFAGLGRARVDPEKLKQAVLNLLVNAVDAVAPEVQRPPSPTHASASPVATSPGDAAPAAAATGPPASRVQTPTGRSAARSPSGLVRLVGRRTDREVLIAVGDDGPGIAAAQRERIFDLYYTTKPAGTGLGLGLVQRIVAEHGGRIDVDSDVGRGATFTLHLPLGADDAA